MRSHVCEVEYCFDADEATLNWIKSAKRKGMTGIGRKEEKIEENKQKICPDNGRQNLVA